MSTGTTYPTIDDFGVYGLPPSMTTNLKSADVLKILEAQSRVADGYFGRLGSAVPLTTWGSDVVSNVCALAALIVLKTLIGVNPSDPANQSFSEGAILATNWFRDVAAGRVTPTNLTLVAADGTPTLGAPEMSSDPLRGWGTPGGVW